MEQLREDPAFACDYLAAALAEAGQDGGAEALLAALHHVAEAQGMYTVAQRAGIPRESLYRALSPDGALALKALLAVLGVAGLRLGIYRVGA